MNNKIRNLPGLNPDSISTKFNTKIDNSEIILYDHNCKCKCDCRFMDGYCTLAPVTFTRLIKIDGNIVRQEIKACNHFSGCKYNSTTCSDNDHQYNKYES